MDAAKNASTQNFFDKIWVKYGLISAGIAIFITVIYYVVDDTLLADPLFSFLPLIAILVTAILAALELRKRQDNYLAYSQSVTTQLGSFSLGLMISTAFNMILYLLIDPELLKKIMNIQIKKLATMVDEGKLPKDAYNEAVRQISEKGSEMFLFNLLIGVIGLIIVALIIFLISSAILKREPKTQI
ncbi:MAG: DUF4199 domain-containing protein [Sphingobacteriales bacterium]|nr:MAG: DUF4199 domain-containing protein [Sphingobacteriales bacterium]